VSAKVFIDFAHLVGDRIESEDKFDFVVSFITILYNNVQQLLKLTSTQIEVPSLILCYQNSRIIINMTYFFAPADTFSRQDPR
jgi:hypothetical protein